MNWRVSRVGSIVRPLESGYPVKKWSARANLQRETTPVCGTRITQSLPSQIGTMLN